MLIRMHLSLVASLVSLAVATASYLLASRIERDQRHLRRRFQKLRAQIEAHTPSMEASPRNGDRAERAVGGKALREL
jgi:hypothetical protein